MGVISGVGKPAKFVATPCDEEDDLYEMLLRRLGLSSSMIDTGDEVSCAAMLRLRESRRDAGDGVMDWRVVMTFVDFIESSMILDDGVRARDFRPIRGLGVREGVGSPENVLTRFSGVKDNGRRVRFAGRGRDGVAFVIATEGVMGADEEGVSATGRVVSCLANSSSSSSSSSTKV